MSIQNDSFFYVPNFYTFQNDNSFYGSFRGLRFYITLEKADKVITNFVVSVWYGEYCMEDSEIVASEKFAFDEQGYNSVIEWLDVQYQIYKNK